MAGHSSYNGRGYGRQSHRLQEGTKYDVRSTYSKDHDLIRPPQPRASSYQIFNASNLQYNTSSTTCRTDNYTFAPTHATNHRKHAYLDLLVEQPVPTLTDATAWQLFTAFISVLFWKTSSLPQSGLRYRFAQFWKSLACVVCWLVWLDEVLRIASADVQHDGKSGEYGVEGAGVGWFEFFGRGIWDWKCRCTAGHQSSMYIREEHVAHQNPRDQPQYEPHPTDPPPPPQPFYKKCAQHKKRTRPECPGRFHVPGGFFECDDGPACRQRYDPQRHIPPPETEPEKFQGEDFKCPEVCLTTRKPASEKRPGMPKYAATWLKQKLTARPLPRETQTDTPAFNPPTGPRSMTNPPVFNPPTGPRNMTNSPQVQQHAIGPLGNHVLTRDAPTSNDSAPINPEPDNEHPFDSWFRDEYGTVPTVEEGGESSGSNLYPQLPQTSGEPMGTYQNYQPQQVEEVGGVGDATDIDSLPYNPEPVVEQVIDSGYIGRYRIHRSDSTDPEPMDIDKVEDMGEKMDTDSGYDSAEVEDTRDNMDLSRYPQPRRPYRY